jgi:hypothetical protein
LGKIHFEKIGGKEGFSKSGFGYLGELKDEKPTSKTPAELTKAECTEFLLSFCKDHSSPKKSISLLSISFKIWIKLPKQKN